MYIYFSYKVYKAKKQLTAIDWNYHVNLPKATNKSGDEVVTRKYNPRTRQWDVKTVKVEKGYQYVPILLSKIISRRIHDIDFVTQNVSLNASDPCNIAPTIAHTPAPSTRDLPQRRSRFAKND